MANFIWDLDGTLINSYPHTLEALAETYQALRLSFDREAVATYISIILSVTSLPIWWLLVRWNATLLWLDSNKRLLRGTDRLVPWKGRMPP